MFRSSDLQQVFFSVRDDLECCRLSGFQCPILAITIAPQSFRTAWQKRATVGHWEGEEAVLAVVGNKLDLADERQVGAPWFFLGAPGLGVVL